MKTNDTNNTCILVVDDNDLVLKTLNLLVPSFGYKCRVASNGLEAVELLKTDSFDLVLTDMKMPGMDGIVLLHHITQLYPDTGVIIAADYSECASYAEVIKAGAIDYITKPIDQGELEAKLMRALREKAILRKLEQLSMHDSLTSLFNRRAFEIYLHREIDRADRQRYSIFLAMLDIDNFKEYNDSYGHQKGDNVLTTLAEILLECSRNSVDTCFRVGGDEFAVILPQTNADQATEIIQRILLNYVEQGFGTTSLSIGIVSCKCDPLLTIEEDGKLIKNHVDQALYDAKKSGKNCVVCRI